MESRDSKSKINKNAKVEAFSIRQDKKDVELLKEATMRNKSLSRTLWELYSAIQSNIQFSESRDNYENMLE